jgi:hypothetical protein
VLGRPASQGRRRRRRLLTRRARIASGTATQCTRRNDSPPPLPTLPAEAEPLRGARGGRAAAAAAARVGEPPPPAAEMGLRSPSSELVGEARDAVRRVPRRDRGWCDAPPPPIDAPCTHCLRHGDPMHAQERLTAAAAAAAAASLRHPRGVDLVA